jgi:Zn-dependent protease
MNMFTKEELIDITIAILVLTFMFAFKSPTFIDFANLPTYFLIVLTAFVCHELAHKFVAMKFHCAAFFKLWPTGVFLALLLMLLGVKFAALGAVVIYPYRFGRWGFRRPYLTETESGLISVAGPVVNLIFALTFLLAGPSFQLVAFVNSWLFLFNMFPVPPLDGSKILRWNIALWTILFIISLVLVVPYFL